jgi:hypothetical protein
MIFYNRIVLYIHQLLQSRNWIKCIVNIKFENKRIRTYQIFELIIDKNSLDIKSHGAGRSGKHVSVDGYNNDDDNNNDDVNINNDNNDGVVDDDSNELS